MVRFWPRVVRGRVHWRLVQEMLQKGLLIELSHIQIGWMSLICWLTWSRGIDVIRDKIVESWWDRESLNLLFTGSCLVRLWCIWDHCHSFDRWSHIYRVSVSTYLRVTTNHADRTVISAMIWLVILSWYYNRLILSPYSTVSSWSNIGCWLIVSRCTNNWDIMWLFSAVTRWSRPQLRRSTFILNTRCLRVVK